MSNVIAASSVCEQLDETTLVNHGNPGSSENSLISSSSASAVSNGSSPSAPSYLVKKKRNLPGTPDPTAEVISLSPNTLMSTHRFTCEVCHKGFQRDQNLQLHRRAHNLPWKLKQRSATAPSGNETRKRVYVCPEPSCVHHHPSRALGDLTGIKKHFSRKHGDKKWKCEQCSKKYAVRSDWKAHSKTCGTREYKCDCGTIFSRRDSFITHRAFCDALTDDHPKPYSTNVPSLSPTMPSSSDLVFTSMPSLNRNPPMIPQLSDYKHTMAAPMSATALLQKVAQMGATPANNVPSVITPLAFLSQGGELNSTRVSIRDGFCFPAGDVGILGLTGVDEASTTVDFMGIGGGNGGSRSNAMLGQRMMRTTTMHMQSLQQQTTVSEQEQQQQKQQYKPMWDV
ncbi:hypothetical protein MLD38_035896 [Melastoma candidum]|uniref:Uncharacterized protein n=1 Tax=Melastoma candidum TaxID=119954 RepID=A0ACB9LJU1_9MYRT|nr:hypothetical protein MLD38_035896 [Melastoma candidum]